MRKPRSVALADFLKIRLQAVLYIWRLTADFPAITQGHSGGLMGSQVRLLAPWEVS